MDPRTLRDLSNDDLRSKITDLERSALALSNDMAEAQARASSLRAEWARQTQQLNTIKNELERRLTPPPQPRVSEHAVLRYIERVMGIDVDAIRANILSDEVVKAIQMGARAVTVNGVKFAVEGVTIVTTLSSEQRLKRERRGRIVEIPPASAAIAQGLADYEDERASNGSAS